MTSPDLNLPPKAQLLRSPPGEASPGVSTWGLWGEQRRERQRGEAQEVRRGLVLEVREAQKGPGCLKWVGEGTQVLLGDDPHTSGAHRWQHRAPRGQGEPGSFFPPGRPVHPGPEEAQPLEVW